MSALPRRAVTPLLCSIMQPLPHYVKKKTAVLGSQINSTSYYAMQSLWFCHLHAALHNYSCPTFTIQAVACHSLRAVTLVLHSEYSLCSCVTPCCPTNNALPARDTIRAPLGHNCCWRPHLVTLSVTQSLLRFAVEHVWTFALWRSAHT